MPKRTRDGGVTDSTNANSLVDLDEVVDVRRLLRVLADFGVPTSSLAQPSPTPARVMPPSFDADDHGFRDMTFDPQLAQINSGGTIMVSGSVHAVRLQPWSGLPFNTVTVAISNAGSSMTSGQSFMSVLDASSGVTAVELARSTDLSGSWGSTGARAVTLDKIVSPRAGQKLLIALLAVSTGTMPSLRTGAAGATMANIGLTTASPYRSCVLATSQTSMATSFTLSSSTTSGVYFWAGTSLV